jgi:hypothetical protein
MFMNTVFKSSQKTDVSAAQRSQIKPSICLLIPGLKLPVLRGKLGDSVRHFETGLLQQGLQDILPSKTIFNFLFKIGRNTTVYCSELISEKPQIRYRYLLISQNGGRPFLNKFE